MFLQRGYLCLKIHKLFTVFIFSIFELILFPFALKADSGRNKGDSFVFMDKFLSPTLFLKSKRLYLESIIFTVRLNQYALYLLLFAFELLILFD